MTDRGIFTAVQILVVFLAIIAVSAQFGRFFGRSTGFLIFSPLSPFLLVSAYF